MSSQPAQQQFSLSSSDEGFKSRSSDIFAVLDVIEEKHTAEEKVREKSQVKEKRDCDNEEDEPDTRCRDGHSGQNRHSTYKDSYSKSRDDGLKNQSFKHPNRPPPRKFSNRNRPPDHRLHPGRWTRYDLSDVTADQLTETSNTAAAFDFLNERRKLREAESDDQSASDSCDKIVFSKPKEPKDSESSSQKIKISTFTGARVLEEYVVGHKKKKMREKAPPGGLSCDKVDLGLTDSDGAEREDREDAEDDRKRARKESEENDLEKTAEKNEFKQVKRKKRNTRQKQCDEDDET